MKYLTVLILLSGVNLVACSSDNSSDGGSDGGLSTILGDDPFEYEELDTSDFGSPEDTGYTLDDIGMRNTGTLDRDTFD